MPPGLFSLPTVQNKFQGDGGKEKMGEGKERERGTRSTGEDLPLILTKEWNGQAHTETLEREG
jgi:hypothetical protein